MIDNNNVYTLLDTNDALNIVAGFATAAGITITSGSVEEQLQNWMAQFLTENDKAMFKSYQMQFDPVGTEIDLQNPNTPRLLAKISSGYLSLANTSGGTIVVTSNSIFTAPNGNTYTTNNNTVSIPNGQTKTITVYSTLEGASQNIPSGQSFTSSYTLAATNPQPFTNGRDKESDTDYLNRIIYDLTNNSSQQSTPAAEAELKDYYQLARIFVNNTANASALPIVIPPNGYLPIVLFSSGVNADAGEINNALQILANRFEFGNPISIPTARHPLLSGTIYSGTLPEIYYVAPAQAVTTTITIALSVEFMVNVGEVEKINLANSFAKFIAQNLIDYFGGAEGNFNCTFNSLIPATTVTSVSVIAKQGSNFIIGPDFSIEQIRALISDKYQIQILKGLEYLSLDTLSLVFDPGSGQPTYDLNITPGLYTIQEINFLSNALFTDGSSWYDRYIFINPSLISIAITEVA